MIRPFVATAVIALGFSFIALSFNRTLICAAAVLLILAVFSLRLYFSHKSIDNTNILIIIPLFVILLVVSTTISFFHDAFYKSRLTDTDAILTATVISEPVDKEEYRFYTLKAYHPVLGKTVKFTAGEDELEADIGDKITMTVKFREVSPKYRAFSYSEGIFTSAYINKIHSVSENASKLHTAFGDLRYYIKSRIFASSDGDDAAILAALATGDVAHISGRLYSDTKACGVTHFLVVSGFHLSIISGALLFVFRYLNLKKRLVVFILFGAICLMTVICNFHSSAIRSAVMSMVNLIAPLLNRKADSLNSLGFSATVMMIFNPFLAGNAAFLLSVFATFGVVYLSPALSFLIYTVIFSEKLSPRLGRVISALLISVSALICVLPITVYYYGYVSLLSPLVTLIISFAINGGLVLTLLGVSVSPIPLIYVFTPLLISLSALLARFCTVVISFFAKAEFLIFVIGNENWTVTALFTIAFVALIRYLYYKKSQERKMKDASLGEKPEKLS